MNRFSNLDTHNYWQPPCQFDADTKQVDADLVLDNIYDKAQIPATKELIFEVIASAFFTNFDAFDSGQFEELLVILMTSQKESGDSAICTDQDIQVTLDKLKNHVCCTPEMILAITDRQQNPDLFHLKEGLARYNQHPKASHKNVTVIPHILFHLPVDLHPSITQPLSSKDVISLALTCKQQQDMFWMVKLTSKGKAQITDKLSAKDVFLMYPEYRLEHHLLEDQKGIDYLQLELNCGPLTIQRIKNRESTIDQEKTEMKKKADRFDKKSFIEEMQNTNPDFSINLSDAEVEAFKKYIIDGSLTPVQLTENLWGATANNDLREIAFYIGTKQIQTCLDNGKLATEQLINYCGQDQIKKLAHFLKYEDVRDEINSGKLAISQLVQKRDGAVDHALEFSLTNEHMKKYREDHNLSIDWLIKWPHLKEFARVLNLNDIFQKYLGNGKLTGERFINLLNNLRVNQPDNDSAIAIHRTHALRFILQEAEKYLDNGSLEMDQIFESENPAEFTEVLEDKQIQLYLDDDADDTLTIEKLATMPKVKNFCVALNLEGVKKNLGDGNLRLDWFIKQWNNNPDNTFALAKFLDNQQVQEDLKNNIYTLEDLVKLPIASLSIILEHPSIKECLNKSGLTLNELIQLPNLDSVSYVLSIPNHFFQQQITPHGIKQFINMPDFDSLAYALKTMENKGCFHHLYFDQKVAESFFKQLLPKISEFAAFLKKYGVCFKPSSFVKIIETGTFENVIENLPALCLDENFQKYFPPEIREKLVSSLKDSYLSNRQSEMVAKVLKNIQFHKYLNVDQETGKMLLSFMDALQRPLYRESDNSHSGAKEILKSVAKILQIPELQPYFKTDALTIPMLMTATPSGRKALTKETVQRCLATERTTIEKVLGSTEADLLLLSRKGIPGYLQALDAKDRDGDRDSGCSIM